MRDRLATAAAAALLAAASVAPASAQTAFTDWDANGNGGVGPVEWNTGWNSYGAFPSFDLDNDGALSQSELATATGLDETGAIEGAGGDNAFSDRFGQQAFADWDVNADGMLTQREFFTGVFDGYDGDDDGVIGEDEFAAFSDDFGQGGFWVIPTAPAGQ